MNLESCRVAIGNTIALSLFTAIVAIVCRVLAPLSPVITLIVVLFLTIGTLENKKTTIMALVGIALYLFSWPALHLWGTWVSVTVWFIGLLTWYWAVLRSITGQRLLATIVR